MSLATFLNLSLPVLLAFAAIVVVGLAFGWAVAGLRRPAVARAAARRMPPVRRRRG